MGILGTLNGEGNLVVKDEGLELEVDYEIVVSSSGNYMKTTSGTLNLKQNPSSIGRLMEFESADLHLQTGDVVQINFSEIPLPAGPARFVVSGRLPGF